MASDATIRSYKDLDVWRVAMDLAEACYRSTQTFPRDELSGMTGQIRRSAASIPANIAEGYRREGTASYIQFLRIAQGSLKELGTHLLLGQRVEFLTEDSATPLLAECDRVSRMLRNFIRSLQAKTNP